MGFYELVCDWCKRPIHQSWVCAWFEEDELRSFTTLHRKRCLKEFLAEYDDRTWHHRGAPYFKLEIPWMGDDINLGEWEWMSE